MNKINILFLVLFCLQAKAEIHDNTQIIEKAFQSRELIDDKKDLFSKSDPEGLSVTGWFFDKDAIDMLIAKIKDEYIDGPGETLDIRDRNIIDIFKKDLNSYYMHIPKIIYEKPYSSKFKTYEDTAIYKITGFNTIKLSDNVEKFVALFLAGAHFVILGENPLLADVAKLPASIKAYKHSHYQQTDQALVYPDITWNTKTPSPIIAALLLDEIKIEDKIIGTFFQLEGWPVHEKSDMLNDTYYHGIDFIRHFKTLWNISTYGMSPYSEKRGTSIFLTKTAEPPDLKEITLTFTKNYTDYAIEERQ
jgi:hypothetical protein